ncbi:MAG: ribosomal protein S18-alanine N-acetyltransferase [Terriglobales bacterium]
MPATIRPAALNDVPAILAIERPASSAAHWSSDQYNKLIANENGIVLVAETSAAADEPGKLSGFLCAHAIAGEWEIENIVVAADFLRQGIASDLVRALTQRAKSQTALAILLEVRESNHPARALYEKHGFRETGRRPAYYLNPIEAAILYALRFNR